MNIILCGLPMCGKTTVSKLLAEKLNWNCIDTDRLIERSFAARYGKVLSCREIYAMAGKSAFRQLETNEIHSLIELREHVIAVGGGSFDHPGNVTALQMAGRVIYLQTDAGMIWRRMALQDIPAYLNAQDPETSFYELAAKREAIFAANAQTIVNADCMTPREVVKAILERMGDMDGMDYRDGMDKKFNRISSI